MIDEVVVTSAIIERYMEDLNSYIVSDVAIAGAGPAGLTAGYYLAKSGVKTAIFERKLSIGGGMWGGGMMFNHIVVQEAAREILDELEINVKPYKEKGYYTVDSIEAVTTLASQAVKAGVKVFNLVFAEDVMVRDNRVTGLVLNWSAAEIAKLHIDPMSVEAKFVVDGTGHDCVITRILHEKMGVSLNTASGGIEGEKSMWAEAAEKAVPKNTQEVFPGLYVAGLAANAVYGDHRMGPIFGGMFLSGKKVADMLIKEI